MSSPKLILNVTDMVFELLGSTENDCDEKLAVTPFKGVMFALKLTDEFEKL
jgi:hypothetical protein